MSRNFKRRSRTRRFWLKRTGKSGIGILYWSYWRVTWSLSRVLTLFTKPDLSRDYLSFICRKNKPSSSYLGSRKMKSMLSVATCWSSVWFMTREAAKCCRLKRNLFSSWVFRFMSNTTNFFSSKGLSCSPFRSYWSLRCNSWLIAIKDAISRRTARL